MTHVGGDGGTSRSRSDEARLTALEAEVAALRGELAELRDRRGRTAPSSPPAEAPSAGRRRAVRARRPVENLVQCAACVAQRPLARVVGRAIRDPRRGGVRDPPRRRDAGRLGGPARPALARAADRRRRCDHCLRRCRGLAVPTQGRAALWQRVARARARDDRCRRLGSGAPAAHRAGGARAPRRGSRRSRHRRAGDAGRERVPLLRGRGGGTVRPVRHGRHGGQTGYAARLWRPGAPRRHPRFEAPELAACRGVY